MFCSVGGCAYSTKSWGGFRVHVSRNHCRFESVENDVPFGIHSEVDNENDSFQVKNVGSKTETQRLMCNAAFSLSLEGHHKLSQVVIDSVIKSTSMLIEDQVKIFGENIRSKLRAQMLPDDFLNSIPIEHMLDKFDSNAKRETFYKKQLSLVQPEAVKLASTIVTVNGRLVRKERYGYIIPFDESLAKFLELPEVSSFIESGHRSSNEYMLDICDGEYIKNNPSFMRNPKALQVILNTDDIEIVNPIGSHTKKHKLSMFCYTLGNIPPEYRSQLHAIQLLAVAKATDIRSRGPGILLKQFLSCVNAMSAGGMQVKVSGNDHIMKGV